MTDYIGDHDFDLAVEIVEDEISKWVECGYRTALAGLGDYGDEPARRKAVEEMRHLHLAEPHLPALAVVQRLRAVALLDSPADA